MQIQWVYTQARGGGYGYSPGPPLGFRPRPHYDSRSVCSPCMSTPHFLTWRHPWSHTLYTGSKLFLLHLLIFAMEVGKQRQGYQCCCSEEENGTFLHCFYSCNDDGDFADITRRVKIAAVCTVRSYQILGSPQSILQKIVPKGDWGHLLTLTLTSDDLESHTVVNVSSTSNIIPSFIKIRRSRFFGKLWSHITR